MTADRQKLRLQREKGPDRQSWVTSTEFAALLGVNPRTFRRWQSSGSVPQPRARTVSGYALWSPLQQQEMIRKRAHTDD